MSCVSFGWVWLGRVEYDGVTMCGVVCTLIGWYMW